MEIELTASEMMVAAQIGCRRNIESVLSKRSDIIGLSNGWENDIEGALAETAFAKHFNMWLDPNLSKFGTKDVGEWHIRSTKHENGHLCIHPNEYEGKYVLMVGRLNHWRIAGWIDASEGRQEQFLRTMRNDRPVPCYWVPQSNLRHI
jgi:hypothetical protein